jgi:hypothetical protein
MKFDAARVSELIEKLAEPQYQGQEGEAKVADFVAEQFTQMGMMVERREVVGSRFPQRVAPWVGWLGYATLITASYVMLVSNHRLYTDAALLLLMVGWVWLAIVLRNGIRFGRRRPPLEAAPLVIAAFPSDSSPPVRIVFQSVLGGLKTDFFQSFRLNRISIAMTLHLAFLICAAWQFYIRPSGTFLLAFNSVVFATIWTLIVCVLSREFGRSRALNRSQYAERRGLSVLVELARCWQRSRSKQVEAVFVAAGGQRLDYAGSCEVVHLLKSEWSTKRTFLVLFFAPGAGEELLVSEGVANHSGLKKLVDDAATSLWIPIQHADLFAIAPFWPIASTGAAQRIAIIGSDLNAPSDAPVDPQVLHRAIQLSSEIALRWAKNQQKPADS